MNVFAINGSPKGPRSNTYRLTSAFLEGMGRGTSMAVREAAVKNLNIHSCLGCFACWNKTPGKCCISDDMASVIENMLWADVIIWSFPLYYFSIPGPLKNLMDRQLPMSLPFMAADAKSGGHPSRYDMSGKRHVVISTCGFYTAEDNYDGVNAIFDHLCGKDNYTSIYCGQGELFRVPELRQRTDAYLSWVADAGYEFSNGAITQATRDKLSQLLYPRATFEAMADASWGIEKSGEASDETLTFTKQMAALYNKGSHSGKDVILEMRYTDVDKRFQILMTQDGAQVITDHFHTPDTIIETPYTVWKAIASGEISGQDALMQQKYRVRGNFELMIHWDRYFGSQQTAEPKVSNVKPTNMMLLLLPWMVFWITSAALDAPNAARISIIASVLLPLIFFKYRTILFDNISAIAVNLCGILLFMDVGMELVLPLSYLGFGILWTAGGFIRIPLTAHYSLNDYGGEGMLENPLFIRTNRILTLCWGVLYLLMSCWSFFLLREGAFWISTVNSLLPAAMGVFTVWFQKWYPAHFARGK